MEEYAIPAPIILKRGISIIDRIIFDNNASPDENTNILLFWTLLTADASITVPMKRDVTNIIIISGM